MKQSYRNHGKQLNIFVLWLRGFSDDEHPQLWPKKIDSRSCLLLTISKTTSNKLKWNRIECILINRKYFKQNV